MSRFPRAYRLQFQAADEANIQRATRDSTDDGKRYVNTPGGDARKMRGIPMYAKGVQGVMAGSSPLGELMAKQPHDH